MSLLNELSRRNVIRVAIAYLAGSWLAIQVLETLFPIFGLAATSIQVVVIFLAIGFVPAVILAWAFQLTPEGLKLDAGVDSASPATSGKTLDRIIIVTLTLAVDASTALRLAHAMAHGDVFVVRATGAPKVAVGEAWTDDA